MCRRAIGLLVAVLLPVVIGGFGAPSWAQASHESPEPCTAAAAGPAVLPPAVVDDGPIIAPPALVADLDAWMAGMRAINPDLSIRTDMRQLDREAALIRAELTRPMSRREAWLHFARLNPYLRDGHSGIQMPGYREALQAHLKAGGRIVPVEIRFARDGSLQVSTVAPGSEAIQPGDRLLEINGHSAKQLITDMMARSIGDTPAYQHAFLTRRFAMLFWYLYGDTGQYDIVVHSIRTGCSVHVRAPGAATLPEALQPQPDARELFDWRILPGNIGYLRVDSFDPDQKAGLDAVTAAAFAAFEKQKSVALIIDVRENGGGDDPLWQQDLVNHFTTKPYVQLSHYVARVTNENADPGDVIGSVQSAGYDKRFTPPEQDPLRFNRPVYILAGPYSYSATIQFIVAAQDFGLARIAGEETAAMACQTGQVSPIELRWTGLSAVTPRIAYTRPSGRGCQRGVIPDIPIPIDEVDPQETLRMLVTKIDNHAQP